MVATCYQLRFKGEADTTIRAAFPDFEISVVHGSTVLRGWVPDQAALHGALDRIQNLGLELIEVNTTLDGPSA